MSATEKPIDRRSFLALSSGAALSCSLPELAIGSPAVRSLTGHAFGASWSVTVPAAAYAEKLREPIEKLLAEVDQQMSPWRTDSAVSRLGGAKAGRVGIPNELAYVTSASLYLADASGGIFDPTGGPLVARWGFGPIRDGKHLGWKGLSIDGDVVIKEQEGLTLDLCGIAKGYALDRIAKLLLGDGLRDFMIDLGGELVGMGRHPSGRPWRAGVEDPRPGYAGLVEVLHLDDMAVATSGSRANSYASGSRRYSHIIDPRTGEPTADDLVSVSVISADAMIADGWATALMAAGANDGPLLARQNNIAALFLIRDGKGLRRMTTGAFNDHLA
jgi:thiamine biosynthesis lipoprotein